MEIQEHLSIASIYEICVVNLQEGKNLRPFTVLDMIYDVTKNQKKAGLVILKTEKADFRTRNTTRDKEITSARRHNNPKYVRPNKASKYMNQKLVDVKEK